MSSISSQKGSPNDSVQKTFSCPSCTKRFGASAALAQHRRAAKHSAVTDRQNSSSHGASSGGPKTEASSAPINGHQNGQNNPGAVKSVACPNCTCKFATKRDLRKHSNDPSSHCRQTATSKVVQTTAPTNSETVSCPLCRRRFHTADALRQHTIATGSQCVKSTSKLAAQSKGKFSARKAFNQRLEDNVSQNLIRNIDLTSSEPISLPIRGKPECGLTASAGSSSDKDYVNPRSGVVKLANDSDAQVGQHATQSQKADQLTSNSDQSPTSTEVQLQPLKAAQPPPLTNEEQSTNVAQTVKLKHIQQDNAVTRPNPNTQSNKTDKSKQPESAESSGTSLETPTLPSPCLPLPGRGWSEIAPTEHSNVIRKLHNKIHDLDTLRANNYPFIKPDQSSASAFDDLYKLIQCDICGCT